MAHFVVVALICSRNVRLVRLGHKPRLRLELHPFGKVYNTKFV